MHSVEFNTQTKHSEHLHAQLSRATVITRLGKGKAVLLSLYNDLYNKIVRLEWRVSPELL